MTTSDAIDMLRQIASYLTAGNPVWRTEPIRKACDMAIEALTEREASAEPRWIPVTERLPKPYEYCLWTTTDGRVIYHHCDGLFSNYTAWMPLPEPWEGADDER